MTSADPRFDGPADHRRRGVVTAAIIWPGPDVLFAAVGAPVPDRRGPELERTPARHGVALRPRRRPGNGDSSLHPNL